MRIFKNGKEPPYMGGDEKLTKEKVLHTVKCMTLEGLATAAGSYFLVMQALGKTPRQMMEVLEGEKTNPVKYTPELDLKGGENKTVHKWSN